MFPDVRDLLASLNLDVVESKSIDARRQSRRKVPSAYSSGQIADVVKQISHDGRLWKHQSLALRHLAAGRNVVVSTGTASGKSLIFQMHALQLLLANSEAKVLALYPLRALASDQLISWQARAQSAGLERGDVAYISSDLSSDDREQVMERARVVMMTPDLCQAWLMRQIDSSFASRFLENLALLVLDEAHTYESVFGSNLSFLVRRIIAAKRRMSTQKSRRRPVQVIAATATIAEPAGHLKDLTGLKFQVVDEDDNGAPRNKMQILHVDAPDQGDDAEKVVANLIEGLGELKRRHRFIAFMDSRQGVERISDLVAMKDVNPYRSGYEQRDRASIEASLRNGTLHGVVSTSALELGIDIEDVEIGINMGVPQSRKSFRQRLGRVGRHSPGIFLIMAPASAFNQFGESLSDYFDSSVEPSYLYLGNRFIQFAHASCLRDEMEALGMRPDRTPPGAEWPDGFRDILRYARESWPREFDDIARTGGDSPHRNFPLRQIGETKIQLQIGNRSSSKEIGDIAHHQALREAFPGAHYLHNGRKYQVTGWGHGFAEIAILLRPIQDRLPIRPLLRKSVTVDLSQRGIVDGRVRRGNAGVIAEVEVQVNESVEGYRIGGRSFRYSDLRKKNANMSRERRFFRTTGIVIKIEEDWFKSRAVREEVANGLNDLLCRDKSISPRDVDTAARNVLIRKASAPQPLADAIVVYDSVYGGLRLTESLLDEIDDYIEKLRRAVKFAGEDAIVSEWTLNQLEAWLKTLDSTDLGESIEIDVPEGWFVIYKPGSLVSLSVYSGLVEREIVKPVFGAPFGEGEPSLNYFCKDLAQPDVRSTISHESVVPTGAGWELMLWNPDTDEYRDLEDWE